MENNSGSYSRLQNIRVIDVCSKICWEIRFRGETDLFPPPSKKFASACLVLHICSPCSRCSFSLFTNPGNVRSRPVAAKIKREIFCWPGPLFLRSSLWLFFLFFLSLVVRQQLDTVCMCVCVCVCMYVLIFRRFFEIAILMTRTQLYDFTIETTETRSLKRVIHWRERERERDNWYLDAWKFAIWCNMRAISVELEVTSYSKRFQANH